MGGVMTNRNSGTVIAWVVVVAASLGPLVTVLWLYGL